ncbi:DUF6049 family protein [Cellulomonas soli]|uniref:DUF6049 family protein n=1 Tax=Cellulomonas soli TaxID=931535 RepID=UPI003F83F293
MTRSPRTPAGLLHGRTHGGARRPATFRALLAAVVGLPLLVGLATGSTAAAAPAPGTVATAEDDALAVTVQITAVTPAVLRPGEDLVVRATVRNDGETTIERPQASVLINRVRSTTRADLQAWTDLAPTAAAGRRVVQDALTGPLAPGSSAVVELTVPADAMGLLEYADAWGPRGLAVEVSDGSRRVGLQRTFLLWMTTDEPEPTRLSVLLPVVGPATTGAGEATTTTDDGTDQGTDATADATPGGTTPEESAAAQQLTAELEDLTGPQGRLTALLTITRTHPGVGWAVDPALLQQAAAGGTRAQDWVEQVTGTLTGRDVFALPWSDPDLSAAAHAGQGDLVGVARDLSAATSTDLVGVTPRTDLLWAPPTGTDKTTAALAAELGAGTLVVGPDLLAPTDEKVTAGARAAVDTDSGSIAALVPDATLDALLTDPTSVQAGATSATTVQRVLAETAIVSREDTTAVRHLLIAPGRAWQPDVPAVTAVLDALERASWVQVTPVSTLIGSSDTGAARTDLPASDRAETVMPVAEVQALTAAHDAAQAFATVSADPVTLLAGVDQSLVAPLAVAWREDPAGRALLVQQALADTRTRLTGLTIAPLSNAKIISARSPVRVVVRNDLPTDVTVQVELRPAKACLSTDGPVTATVAAGTEETVPVTLIAAANCDVRVDAVLTTTTGQVVAPVVTFVAWASPTIEDVGTIVVGVLLAVGLILGVVRTVRRGQSARRGARTEAEAIATGGVATVGVLGKSGPPTGATATTPPHPEEQR